jgi:hypothetical protein
LWPLAAKPLHLERQALLCTAGRLNWIKGSRQSPQHVPRPTEASDLDDHTKEPQALERIHKRLMTDAHVSRVLALR